MRPPQPGADESIGTPASPPPASRLGDLSGAFADLGTFLPLVLGIFAVQQIDPSGLLVGFGVFALVTAAVYRRPVPVQPMKAVAAVAIAGGLSAAGLAATGLLLGIVLILLAAFGLVGRLGRLIPDNVMLGIQLGVGLYLAWAGIKLMQEQPWLGVAALGLLLVLQRTRAKPLAALAVVVAAAVWGVFHQAQDLPPVDPGLYLPTLAWPDLAAMWESAHDVLFPQLALTLTNATVITAAIAGEYFPGDRARITPDRLAMSTGVVNLLVAPFGGFPMCHGAGGLVVQHRFGARTGLAPLIFGLACLALGVLLGGQALAMLALVPMAAIGSLLLIAGVDLAFTKRLRQAGTKSLVVIALTGLVCVVANVVIGLLAGVVFDWMRRVHARRDRPHRSGPST